MPKPRLSMLKLREVLRLRYSSGLSERGVATSCSVSRSTVASYLARASELGLSWPLPDEMTDADLERAFFPDGKGRKSSERPLPDWSVIHNELKRPGVTLQLLWEEYIETHPEGYRYSWFCSIYRQWRGKLSPTMRQTHKAGDKLFVDYAGQTMPVTDPKTGIVRQAQIFVAALGASNYSYAEATWTQTLPDWIGAHVRAFEFFQGVSRCVVPDNLRTGVTKACFYEPDINPTYLDFARHYGTVILPTRVASPKDKAKVEKAVQDVERRILAALRNRHFFSLASLNEAIADLLEDHNQRPFQRLDGTRLSLFETIDKPALLPLPAQPYQYAEWKKARAGIDYHVPVDGHFYSVPHAYIKCMLDVRITSQTIEFFSKGERIISHQRSPYRGGHTTVYEHMPRSHQRYVDWTPRRLISWARKTGDATAAVVEGILEERPHPEHGFRACMGIMRLAKNYGDDRCEAACRRALQIGSLHYKSVKSILKRGLDQLPLPLPEEDVVPIEHENIRGAGYYD